ncbi:hypothetical protein Q2T83_01780 [Fervidibacter sacchari]|jgi:hypothetical protein|uniref:Uncharacterized protein n=1 Tax=Candidatus Fervidibacter sacchari TaxID=1448929 RepID=A0ABT2ET14_9BACT|nr:hypothetical protein [Candidatus Fervidibacter sacchari]MCS3921077.1 hypothetical protein [Candidatus Fervidibacter sacchari]WKU16567.1 hypothetical protein Q2T83_01780 [Candidatus Fervidibacter sacchari]
MVAQVRMEAGRAKAPATTLSRPGHGIERHQAAQKVIGNWTRRAILSGLMLLSWCLLNALILTEIKTHNWQKQQISLKEMQVYRLQTAIAHRLSGLTRNSPDMFQSAVPPTLLGLHRQKRDLVLLGRR